MTAGRWIAALWIASSVFGGIVFFVYRTTPRVVALQRAGSARAAADVLRHWRSSGQWDTARRNMTLDYGFIATFYPWMALAAWVWGRGIGWTTASTIAAAIREARVLTGRDPATGIEPPSNVHRSTWAGALVWFIVLERVRACARAGRRPADRGGGCAGGRGVRAW